MKNPPIKSILSEKDDLRISVRSETKKGITLWKNITPKRVTA